MSKTCECAITHHGPIVVSNPRILLSFAPFAPLVPHFTLALQRSCDSSCDTVVERHRLIDSNLATPNPSPQRSPSLWEDRSSGACQVAEPWCDVSAATKG